jgi:hypothetical protein
MILAWIVSVLASLAIGSIVGFRYRELRDSMSKILETLKEKADKKSSVESNTSALIDPYSPLYQAQEEHEKLMERLNPGSKK